MLHLHQLFVAALHFVGVLLLETVARPVELWDLIDLLIGFGIYPVNKLLAD